MLGMGGGTRKRQTTSTLARWHQGRNKVHAHRTMRFSKRSRHLEEDDHGNHQTSDATWRDKVKLAQPHISVLPWIPWIYPFFYLCFSQSIINCVVVERILCAMFCNCNVLHVLIWRNSVKWIDVIIPEFCSAFDFRCRGIIFTEMFQDSLYGAHDYSRLSRQCVGEFWPANV